MVDISLWVVSDFFDTFNATLPDFETAFGENWILDGVTWPAIAIDHESETQKTIKGGGYEDVTTTIYVRLQVFQDSKVQTGSIVNARGQDFSVLTIEQEGDDCRALVCGSPQLDVWGR